MDFRLGESGLGGEDTLAGDDDQQPNALLEIFSAGNKIIPPVPDMHFVKVHLGCSEEVSSFRVGLFNFDKKYVETNPINEGNIIKIAIGRGPNVPLLLTSRIEDLDYEDTPVLNLLWLTGLCKGEQLFHRKVTTILENKRGEEVVDYLIKNYTNLIPEIEGTDTTYILLEYERTPMFDILKKVASSADKAGVIGYDFRVNPDGHFAFFPKNSKISPVVLSENIELSNYHRSIRRIKNRITIFGAAEKPFPDSKDLAESLNPSEGSWSKGSVGSTLSLDSVEKIYGNYSVKTSGGTATALIFTFNNGYEVDANLYPLMIFQPFLPSGFNEIFVRLTDTADNIVEKHERCVNSEWFVRTFGVGRKNSDQWTHSLFNTAPFNWKEIKKNEFIVTTAEGHDFRIDNFHYGGRRWEATEEDLASQQDPKIGLREYSDTDEELHSDEECSLRAKALRDFYKDPAESFDLKSTVIDYGLTPLLPGDVVEGLVIPNENINGDYRIDWAEYIVGGETPELEVVVHLGRAFVLLADYLYKLRSKAASLARTKIAH